MPNKEEIKIRPFWYSDIWIFPKLINVITSLDEEPLDRDPQVLPGTRCRIRDGRRSHGALPQRRLD
jgi:hypothetical protein